MANLIGTTETHANIELAAHASLGFHNSTNTSVMIGGTNNYFNPVVSVLSGDIHNYESYQQFDTNTIFTEMNTLGYYSGYYLKIGEELMRIVSHSYNDNFDTTGTIHPPIVYFSLERGALGTTAVAHSAGEIVEFYDGVPDTYQDQTIQNFVNTNLNISYNKKILFNRPKTNDISVYNFPDGYEDLDYNESIGLPLYNDKFQEKDLYTKCVGDVVNDAIVEKDLKFEGSSYIQIRDIYIQNTGVDGTTINNKIKVWMFSEAAYGGDPTVQSYGTISSKLKDKFVIYDDSPGSKSQGTDIGNLTPLETEPLVSNFADGSIPTIGGITQFEVNEDDDSDLTIPIGGISAFQLSDIPETTSTTIFNEVQYNPIYIVVYSQGDKKVAWPVNSDSRATKYSIFKINNSNLFAQTEAGASGTTYQADLVSSRIEKTSGGGSSWSAQQSAWRVSSLLISINTAGGQRNTFTDVENYRAQIESTLPKVPINENIFDSFEWLAFLNPRTELNNSSNQSGTIRALLRHPDFTTFTSFGFSQNNQLDINFFDLQSYNYDLNLVPKTSTPLNVTFQIDIKGLDGEDMATYQDSYPTEVGSHLFYYFVIDWDDRDDEIKTIDDYLQKRPINNYDYLDKINQNLYKIQKINYSENSNDGLLTNVYTTPGIKTVKFIIFSVWDGDGTDGSPGFEAGRWKLCTSRFYLDVPINQYPDFSAVGGSDYTTIPWPYTTPIIGGVGENSKYKISVQNALSSGKIGNTDIIDEKLLLNDLENDEMGKNIETMDLEQVRYFNTGSYDMNTLLNIPYESEMTIRVYNTDDAHLQTLEGYNGQGMSNVELQYLNPDGWEEFGRPDIGDYIETIDIPNPTIFNTEGRPLETFANPDYEETLTTAFIPYNDSFWDGEIYGTTFSEESSVGQIFISENQDIDLKQSCKLELNTGQISEKTIIDSSGNSNKGMLIGDYKVKKNRKNRPMRRDSFIKVPNKTDNNRGAL